MFGFRRYLADRGLTLQPLTGVALTLMLWALFDGIMSYLIPILITRTGISESQMGLIVGTSSIAGALVDLVLCHLTTKPHFRRYFFGMFALCLIQPLVLGLAHTVTLFVLAMVIWGIYYDLVMFGKFDFVGRYTPHKTHATSFGVINATVAVGFLMSPFLASLALAGQPIWHALGLGWLFLLLGFLVFVAFLPVLRDARPVHDLELDTAICHKRHVLTELHVWGGIIQRLWPVLFLGVFLNMMTAFVWTIGPLFASSFHQLHGFEGIFVTIFELPFILTGWFVGRLTARLGKKRTAYLAIALGCLLLIPIGLTAQVGPVLGFGFLASFVMSFAWPAIHGAFADYISEADRVAHDIEAIEDFSSNLGYIIGPILAGVLADHIGNGLTFSVIGASGVVLAIFLLLITRKHISVAGLATN